MFSTYTYAYAIAIELAGLAVLWRFVLSPTARARASAPSPLPYWNIAGSTFLLAVLLVIGVGMALPLFVAELTRHFDPKISFKEGPGLAIAGSAQHVGWLLGITVAWYFLKTAKFLSVPDDAPATEIPPAPLPWPQIPAAAIATCVIVLALTLPLAITWPWLLEKAGLPAKPQNVVELFASAKSPILVSVIAFLAVFLAPISEELLFRKGLFRFARGRLDKKLAHILPAIIFAALHESLAAAVPLFVVGLVLSVAYERTGRIVVPIIAHGLFNLQTVVFLLLGLDF